MGAELRSDRRTVATDDGTVHRGPDKRYRLTTAHEQADENGEDTQPALPLEAGG